MKASPIITAVVALLAVFGVCFAFLSSASPYVTVAQAKTSPGDRLHLLGDIVKNSVKLDLLHHALTFRLRDPSGAEVTVNHVGEPPANLEAATRVVAIGAMQGPVFVSQDLLIKCPSKYEGQKKTGEVAKR